MRCCAWRLARSFRRWLPSWVYGASSCMIGAVPIAGKRMTAQLRREGRIVNAKRVLRLMREDNLLCLRAGPFVPRAISGHSRELALYYPTGMNRLL